MNYIDKLFMKPLLDNNGNKLSLLEYEDNSETDINTLVRICYVLGEPVNRILTPNIIKKKNNLKLILNNPYI